MPAQGDGEREAGQVDESVGRRDEQRQVVQPVVVDAPDQRSGDLADRRETDDAKRLRAPFDGYLRQRGDKHEPGHDSEPELLWVGREVVEREQGGEVRRSRYCLNWSSCHDGTGASSRSGRPPPGCW
jgi:hypothetical protein